jgi:mRNA-degrading endonuclease toxin of MazEF toxin-antitoxin module
MKRGEIYYITDRNTLGCEIRGARPGVIVSNDILNQTSNVVEVVYLTAQTKKAQPTHAIVNATGRESTALCEQVDTVSTLLVGDYCGTCSEDEMLAIERGLLASLDLAKAKAEDTKAATKLSASEERLLNRLAEVQEERDRYMRMVDVLLAERVAQR